MDVADFHCDLLSYLAQEKERSAYDDVSRTSIPLLLKGGVKLQTMAIFTRTGDNSSALGGEQFQHFLSLPVKYPQIFNDTIQTVLAIENGSSFCDEEESLQNGLQRLETWHQQTPIAYISLTWNGENRFGGGTHTSIGLKPDGYALLEWMEGRSIAVDLSHASDPLARDILKAIENSSMIPIASHSNFRSVAEHPRNLPDDMAQEIAKRGGIIGINFVRHFLKNFILQVQHAEKLHLLDHLCFGADFFEDSLSSLPSTLPRPLFFEGYDSSACYPRALKDLLLLYPKKIVEKIAHCNLRFFLHKLVGVR